MKDKIHISDQELKAMMRNKKTRASPWFIFGAVLGSLVALAVMFLIMLLVAAGIVGLWRFIF